jgi:hypothetical protein
MRRAGSPEFGPAWTRRREEALEEAIPAISAGARRTKHKEAKTLDNSFMAQLSLFISCCN